MLPSSLCAGPIGGRVRRMQKRLIYKLCRMDDWQTAVAAGTFTGSEHDKRDGFIHCSAADQVPGSAARYFPGEDVVLLSIDSGQVADIVKWEENPRGLFPHLYGELPITAVTGVEFVRWNGEDHVLPYLPDA
ncbi:Uncharacterized conserved protein, DUF952 family [Caenispirillum bisanense]|uniref:Uncharacterized conserved protein, DUF952 family n=2 Tax=Caenispirillum bisanense TaxID=414052 RepID=A0A286GN50_9PROT|nr:Uncharacterized conserved protein, DUF952 family [Caenispirillum bisanense]